MFSNFVSKIVPSMR